MKPTVKVQRVHPKAKLPVYAHPGDAGMDLFAVEDKTIAPGERALVNTGIVIELPAETEAQVRPRSGLALKHGVTVLNAPGTIDHGYRGEIGVILINHGQEPFHVEAGMKIAQMVIANVPGVAVVESSSLSETSRDNGGFGSTGV